MVRSTAKQTPDEKKETKKKTSSAAPSSSSVKKKFDTGSWPCKMDDCKKVFAREADLKRHQRTTKTHSIPGFQCPQCDATFTRTDALRRHQKSRHNGVVIEPTEQDKSNHATDGLSSGSRSPSPGGTPSRSQGEVSPNGSPPAGQSSAGPSNRASNYYRPHTMQDGYYAGYPHTPRPPPPGLMIDPHYPPPPIALPTSATRGNWHPQTAPPPWVPEGHPMPPAGMYIPSYYPSPYYRHPGMPIPMPPQVDPGLLAQSNGQSNGVGPPESALRNTSADSPERDESGTGSGQASSGDTTAEGSGAQENGAGAERSASGMDEEGPDASTLMAAAALQAVLAFQKEQEIREAASQSTTAQPQSHTQHGGSAQSPQAQRGRLAESSGSAGATGSLHSQSHTVRVEQPHGARPSVIPLGERPEEDNPDVDAVGEDDQELTVDVADIVHTEATDSSQLVTEDGTPMLNPEELLTQESLASPPPS